MFNKIVKGALGLMTVVAAAPATTPAAAPAASDDHKATVSEHDLAC